jgi:hypothetical protein
VQTRQIVSACLGLLVIALHVPAQTVTTAIVKRSTKLRNDPSSAHPPIRSLTPGEELRVLSVTKVNNYYNVATDANEQGWTYAPNIELSVAASPPPPSQLFPDAHDPKIEGWNGPVFKLSQAYPQTLPSPDSEPWKAFDFRTQSDQYVRAILGYAMEGNVEVNWQGDKNTVRKWFHAPWLHSTNQGREFVHGLTSERVSPARELHPNQTIPVHNYAVGLYNARAGYTIGQVWKDSENPDASAGHFPEGAVAVKLLFTTATVTQVPYMVNSLEWDAHISDTGTSTTRAIAKVRLLQIDVAVRDSRAASTTGWVFGTFAYDGGAPGATAWDRMRPVGVMWGNDPTLGRAHFNAGARVAESVILNPTIGIAQHLGWLGRLNGPVDNKISSCLSCHSTAEYPRGPFLPPGGTSTNTSLDAARLKFFRNIKAGQPFTPGQASLDYSLQLAVGIANFMDARRPPNR